MTTGEGEQRTPQPVKLFTEVSESRAKEMEEGVFESSVPPVHGPGRWQAEWALDHFQPQDFKQKGISRRQAIFASHIPYQGHQPKPDNVLMELEVDADSLYIAESEYISNIITPALSDTPLVNIMERQEIFKSLFPEEVTTRTVFEERLTTLDQSRKDFLLDMSRESAENYWKSVVPYSTYIDQGNSYFEPETLIVEGAKIGDVKRSN